AMVVTRCKKCIQFLGIALFPSQPLSQFVGKLGKRRIEAFPQCAHELRQGPVEVTVDTGAKTYLAHINRVAKTLVLFEQSHQPATLSGVQQRWGDSVAIAVEGGRYAGPVQRPNAIGKGLVTHAAASCSNSFCLRLIPQR